MLERVMDREVGTRVVYHVRIRITSRARSEACLLAAPTLDVLMPLLGTREVETSVGDLDGPNLPSTRLEAFIVICLSVARLGEDC